MLSSATQNHKCNKCDIEYNIVQSNLKPYKLLCVPYYSLGFFFVFLLRNNLLYHLLFNLNSRLTFSLKYLHHLVVLFIPIKIKSIGII